jgi:hypothetical protein
LQLGLQRANTKTNLPFMSFQAYLDNIKAKTGKTPADFKKLAAEKGFMVDGILNPNTKATEITNWLKEEFELGHGHAMAIFASFKGKTE